MEIKKATKKDFYDFVSIKYNFNEEYGILGKDHNFLLKEFSDYLKKGAVFIAITDNRIIGYLCGLIEKDIYGVSGYIGEIFVEEKFRGKGISTRLKDEFISYLKSKQIHICRIDVNPNNSAQEVYKNWGFKTDKYRMSLKL